MTSISEIAELNSDIQELETLLGLVSRSNVRKIIAEGVGLLKKKIDDKKTQTPVRSMASVLPKHNNLYTVKISNYGWDESAKFVKVYVSLPNIDKITQVCWRVSVCWGITGYFIGINFLGY